MLRTHYVPSYWGMIDFGSSHLGTTRPSQKRFDLHTTQIFCSVSVKNLILTAITKDINRFPAFLPPIPWDITTLRHLFSVFAPNIMGHNKNSGITAALFTCNTVGHTVQNSRRMAVLTIAFGREKPTKHLFFYEIAAVLYRAWPFLPPIPWDITIFSTSGT